MLLLLLLACTDPADTADTAPREVPWSGDLLPSEQVWEPLRGLTPRRGIIHLHSPWSHDACDSAGYVDGVLDEACFADLRDALCRTGQDYAYLTDHPDHASGTTFEEWLAPRDEDAWIDGAALAMACPDGRTVTMLPGIEDELMPVGLDSHVDEDVEARHTTYNEDDADAINAFAEHGAVVLSAHTEGRSLEDLTRKVEDGVQGVEIFNLHAMFAPDIRTEDLGLGAFDWVDQISPFTREDGTAEPDLLMLAVLQEQAPSLERFDALQAVADVVGVAGTDAHQNVLNLELRDGERADGYRRMLRWFDNVLLVEDDSPEGLDAALAAGRNVVVFEVLGTPVGLDVHLEDADGIVEIGGTGSEGTLVVDCPGIAPSSPWSGDSPELTVTVFKDGVEWASSCGEHATDGPGAYRVRFDLVPHHLTGFLGESPADWMKAYPWIYTNPIRVR